MRAGFFEAVDGGDVRMVQRGEYLGFALEAGQPIGIARERSGRTFSATSRFSLRIAGAIHFAHAAGPERREDLVGAEACAGGQGHAG